MNRTATSTVARVTLVQLVLLAVGITVSAQNQDFSKVQIKVTKVSGNIYMLEGEGGNIAASVGEDGIVIVDDQFAPLADKIQAALKSLKITDKPVRFVINTDWHDPNTNGNALWGKSGAILVAQENVRTRLASIAVMKLLAHAKRAGGQPTA